MNRSFLPVILLLPAMLSAQYSYERLNNLNEIRDYSFLYNADISYHTSVRPLNIDEADSLRPVEREDLRFGYKQWFWKKLFDESLIKLKGKNYELNIDPVVNFRLGYDTEDSRTLYTNTRGFSVEGQIPALGAVS